MNDKRGRKTRSRAAWLVTWMALIAIRLTFSTPPTTATDLSCASSSTAEDAHPLQDAPAQVCSVLPTADQDEGTRLEASLAGPQMMAPASGTAPTAPTAQRAAYSRGYRWR